MSELEGAAVAIELVDIDEKPDWGFTTETESEAQLERRRAANKAGQRERKGNRMRTMFWEWCNELL